MSNNKKILNIMGTATLSDVRISPQKLRLALDMVRGMQVEPALNALKFTPKKSAQLAHKVLLSAVANAREGTGVDVDSLWVAGGMVDMGKSLRRWMPRARGRATPIKKRTSHIKVSVGIYE